jgi:putative hydrolase of the HAD superfamily
MRSRQFLIIDADDTLWENNIYFERAFDDFVQFLNHSKLAPGEVRAILDEIEAANAQVHGYGSKNFGRNLRQVYEHLAERDIGDPDLEIVTSFAERILEHPVELIEEVPETLAYLASRHDLTLFTKGHPEEQRLKLDRSGLGPLFAHTAIVKEKNADAYHELVAARGLDPERTWMIGNSPKSDVNPAIAAGLNAVFIPHAHTWVLEKEEIRDSGPGRILTLSSFAELAQHF